MPVRTLALTRTTTSTTHTVSAITSTHQNIIIARPTFLATATTTSYDADTAIYTATMCSAIATQTTSCFHHHYHHHGSYPVYVNLLVFFNTHLCYSLEAVPALSQQLHLQQYTYVVAYGCVCFLFARVV